MKKIKYIILTILTFALFNSKSYAQESKCIQYGDVILPRAEDAALVCLYDKPISDHQEGIAWESERYKVIVTFSSGMENENGEVLNSAIAIYVCSAGTGSNYSCVPFAEFDSKMRMIPDSQADVGTKIGYFKSYSKDGGSSAINYENGSVVKGAQKYTALVPNLEDFTLSGCPSEIDMIMHKNTEFYFSFGETTSSPTLDLNVEKLTLITDPKKIYNFFQHSGNFTNGYYTKGTSNYATPFINDASDYITSAFFPFTENFPRAVNGIVVLGDRMAETLNVQNTFVTTTITDMSDYDENEQYYYNKNSSYKNYQEAINKYCNGDTEVGVDATEANSNNKGRNQDIKDYGDEVPEIKQTLTCEYYFNEEAICSDPQKIIYTVKTLDGDEWVEAKCSSWNISDLSCLIVQYALDKDINSKNTKTNHKYITGYSHSPFGGDSSTYYIQKIGGKYECSPSDNIYLVEYGVDASNLVMTIASKEVIPALETVNSIDYKIKGEKTQSEDCFTNEMREEVLEGTPIKKRTEILNDSNNVKIVYNCAVDHSKDVACGKVYFIPPQLPYLTSLLMNLIKIFVPIALIIKGLMDLFKAITGANDKEIEKARSKFFKRIIPAITVFLVILIVQFIFGIVTTDGENNTFLACSDCFINGTCQPVSKTKVLNYCIDMQAEKTTINSNNGNGGNKSNIGPVDTGVPGEGGICGSNIIYKGQGYDLTEAQKEKIAAMILGEYGSNLNGMKAVASQMANLYEYRKYTKSSCGNKTFYDYITSPKGDKCHWYSTANKAPTNNADALLAVEDVIVNGNRTLPFYVDEFDMYPGEISPKLQPSEYVQGSTKITGAYGGSGKFWCVTPSKSGGNLFYYSSDSYKQYIDSKNN